MTANVQTRMFSDDAWTPPTICQVLSEQQINCSRRSDRWRESSAGHSLHALRLRRPARLAPWIFMIDRLWSWCRVHINHVMTWTANQSSLVTFTLTFWPWKWYPSHVWRSLSLCQFWSSWPLHSRLRPDVRDRRQTDVRQKHRLMPRLLGAEA